VNRKINFILALAFAILTFIGLADHASNSTALAQSTVWTISCKGLVAKDRGLWFDAAGPGPNNEGGFFWIRNRTAADESCTASISIIPGVSTDKYPFMRVRAAVNDGAMFSVQAIKMNSAHSACSVLAGYVIWNGSDDNSEIIGKQLTFTEKTEICMIRMTLTDDPNEIKTYWTNALIDEIRIWDGARTGWEETFTVTPP